MLGNALVALGALRNESNYESLLIAHEKNHRRVTGLFEEMDRYSSDVVKEVTSLAVKGYRACVERAPLLDANREAYRTISDQYVQGRLDARSRGIKSPISDCSSLRPCQQAGRDCRNRPALTPLLCDGF